MLSLCAAGSVSLVASGAHEVEAARCPYPDRRAHVDAVLALSDTYAFGTPGVLRRAQQFEAGGVKHLDAFHLASAVDAEADFFCTTDDQLLNRGREADTGRTRVVSPLELVVHLSQPPDR